MNKRRLKIIGIIVFCICFVMLFFLKMKSAELIIDDLDFRENAGDSIWKNISYSFHYGNGRLLGNTLSAVYANHRLFYAISGAGMLLLLVLLPVYIFDISYVYIPVIGTLLILCNECFWGELYLWSSALANYIPPIIITELCIIMFEHLNERKNISYFSLILLVILSFMGQLYVEHMTVITITLAVALCICGDKITIRYIYRICYLISTVFGGIIMMIIPKVFSHNDSQQNYRAVIMSDMDSNIDEMILSIYEKLSIVLVFTLIMAFIIIFKRERKCVHSHVTKSGFVKKIATYALVFMFIGFLIREGCVRVLLLLVYLGIVVISTESIKYVDDKKFRVAMYTLTALANVVLVCSLPVALPGARLIYISYYCFVIESVLYLQYISEHVKKGVVGRENGYKRKEIF